MNNRDFCIERLAQGATAWNEWRHAHPQFVPDLSGSDLSPDGGVLRIDVNGADFSNARLRDTNLSYTYLPKVDLSNSNCAGAKFVNTNLSRANLRGANLSKADFSRANLFESDLTRAILTGADLTGASLVRTNLIGANLDGCRVYGAAAWNVSLDGTTNQHNLVISAEGEPVITVDNLQIAQFVHLILHNSSIRDALEIMTSKGVLILGRFTPERKAVLDTIRDELRNRKYIPLMFDFEPVKSQTMTQTVSTLAHMARFIIADITEASSVPQEMTATVPQLPLVPVQPILLESGKPWAMFSDFLAYPSVLELFRYKDSGHLIASLDSRVIGPAELKANEQLARWNKARSVFV